MCSNKSKTIQLLQGKMNDINQESKSSFIKLISTGKKLFPGN